MKKYDSYKDSGIEWIGEIPSHWDVKKIKHLCYVKARVGWKGLKSDEFLKEGFAYLVTGSDFYNDTVNWKECYQIDKDRYDDDPFIQLEENDLLITKDGTIGKLAIVSNLDKPACLNSGIFVIRSEDRNFTSQFLFWILKSKMFTKFNEFTSYGSTIQHLYQNVFVEFSFSLPSLAEQTAIANFLDLKTSEIDVIIADKKRLLELYEEEKTAIINKAVTKGINPDAPMKDSGIEWLGEIPEHWEVKKLKNISSIVLGKMLLSQDKGGYSLKPYLRAANLNWINVNVEDVKEMWFSDMEILKYRLKRNDLLVSEGGEVGRTCIWKEELDECYIQNSVHKVTFHDSYEPHYYLQLFFVYGKIGAFDSLVNRISIAHLTAEKLREVEILDLPLKEQQLIVHHIESECSKIDFKKARTEELIELLTEYRTALISEAVTGKIKVTED